MTALHAIPDDPPVFHLMQLFDLNDLNPADIDAIEIHPCATYTDAADIEFTEQCGPDEAQFYAVFFHLKTGGLTCIADCADAHIASHVARCLSSITGVKVYY